MIVLTAEEADKVRGFSPLKEGFAVIPAPLDDGRFKLGEGILEMPEFAHVRDFLASLPREPDAMATVALDEAEIAADEPSKLAVWSEDRPQERAKLLEAAVVMLADKGATLDGLKSR
jgi:hypothetical protein